MPDSLKDVLDTSVKMALLTSLGYMGRPKARENAERQIQLTYFKNQTFMTSHMQECKLNYTCCESSQHVRFQKGFSAKANDAII